MSARGPVREGWLPLAGGRIFVEIALGTLWGRSWRSLCVVLAVLGPLGALVGRFSAAGGAQEASEEGFWYKHICF